MSKFNTKAVNTNRFPNTINRAGGASFAIKDTRTELASVILSSMLKGDKFYQTDSDRIEQIFNLVQSLPDKTFAAKAMIYARQEGNLRSVSHVLANAVAESAGGVVPLRAALNKAIVRPDDMTEMASIWFSRHSGKMLPNSMRRAFRDKLESNTWNAFQLKRYAKPNSSVKLKDIILLSHPRDKRGLLGHLLNGDLRAETSLESKLASGQQASVAFEELLSEGKLGYMAAVKNIRNALQTGISDRALDQWCDLISNRSKVLKSRMLPFRFYDAWMAVKGLPIDHFKLLKVKTAFNKALIHSAENLDIFNTTDKVALIIDESGSMGWSSTSECPWKNAIILAAVLYHAMPNVVVYAFSHSCRKLDFGSLLPIEIIEGTEHGGGATYFRAPMKELIRTHTVVDKLIVLTDMQMYNSYQDEGNFPKYLAEYKKIAPRVMTLFWDLSGYGESTPLSLDETGVLLASGFSDKLLSVIPKMWRNPNALVEEIEAIKI